MVLGEGMAKILWNVELSEAFLYLTSVCVYLLKKRLKVVVRVTFVHNLFIIILIFQTLVTVFALWVLSFC